MTHPTDITRDAKTAESLTALRRALTDEVYEALDGDYSDLPTWGPQTERVRELIHASGPDGDIVSWDTRSADPGSHRYLMRQTDSGRNVFVLLAAEPTTKG